MIRRLATRVALAAVAALLLAGCTPDEPVETTPIPSNPDPSSTGSQTIELLESAETIYENYLNARSRLTQSPDSDIDVLLEFATERQAALAYADVAVLVEEGTMLQGSFEVTGSAFAVEDARSPQLVMCVDNSDVRQVDRQTGNSAPSARTGPVLVSFVTERSLKVDEVAAAEEGSEDQCR